MTIDELNAADRDAFVAALGHVFEHSPWIAAAAWERRPFADRAGLHAAMTAVVDAAPPERQLALIAAHPDLAGESLLTASSRGEQRAAGLDRLDAGQRARFAQLNERYRERFGFPFVICARDHDAASILAALERRTERTREDEIGAALGEIVKIARLRIQDAVAP